MSLFTNILEKLGLKHPSAQTPASNPVTTDTHTTSQIKPVNSAPPKDVSKPPSTTQAKPKPPIPQAGLLHPTPSEYAHNATPSPQAGVKPVTPSQMAPPPPSSIQAGPILPSTPAAIPMVDVVSKLEHLAAANPLLDWKVSIVDLLKLLGLDSSFAARKELAIELGCPPDKMSDSAQMNTWLHKTVLQKLAENGGNIPKELLD